MADTDKVNDKTLLTLCKCREMLVNKLKNETFRNFEKNKEICEQFQCDNRYLLNIINKLSMAKENLNPVIEEIISSASKLNKDDYKHLKEKNDPICSVTTAQFAGAVEASKLLYEINADLNEHDKKARKQINRVQPGNETTDFAINAFVYPTTINGNSAERIFIDKELMQQLIDLHELLGDTITRLKVRESGGASGYYSTKSPSSKPSKKGTCCKKKEPKKQVQSRPISPQRSVQRIPPGTPSPRMSRTLITGDPNKSSSKTYLKVKEIKSPNGSKTELSIRKADSVRVESSPVRTVVVTEKPLCQQIEIKDQEKEKEKEKKKKKCCPKKTKSDVDAKKKAKQEAKLKKKLEKQRKKEIKKQEKEAKKGTKKKKSKSYTCCKKKKSKSATYVRDGTPSTVSNIDEAKQKIMECLNELSNIRVFLNTTSPTELDMENQLQLIGSLANKRDCCDKTFPHIHATLNGIPIVLQLNEVSLNTLIKTPSSKITLSKCKCGPVELEKCPLAMKTDLDMKPVSQKSSSKMSLKVSTSKTTSLPNVPSKGSTQKSSSVERLKRTSKEEVSSAVLWKSPHTLGDIMSSSLTEAELLTTPETSITVFSTKKTKDGQKVRLSLTISPMGGTKGETRTSSKGKPTPKASPYGSKHVIPEKETEFQKAQPYPSSYGEIKGDGFETDESDPGMPYVADNTSLPNFTVEEQRTRTTLTDTGICHPDQFVQKELEDMGIDNILKICRPAKCCRKTVINEKPRNALPYPASLMSLPLDKEDIVRIRADVKRSSSIYYCKYQTFNFETYTKFQRNDKFPWHIQTTFEVRFFEIFKMDKKPARQVNPRQRCYKPQKRYVPPQINNDKYTTNRQNFPFSTFMTGFPFNLHLFDTLRRKGYKNSDSQTYDDVDEIDDVRLITPTKYKKNSQRQKPANLKTHKKSPLRDNCKKSFGFDDMPQESVFPYNHEDIACFRSERISHKVHFKAPIKLDTSTKSATSKSLSSERNISSCETNGKTIGANIKLANSIIVQNKEDSLIKLIPLQPYLVEKMLEDKTKLEDDSSKSILYNSSVNTIDSRIIYKKHQSEELYYITSKTFDNVEKKKPMENSFTSMYKNSVFYPFKPPEYVTYYNTVHTNGNTTKSPYKYSFNTHKPCECRDVSSFHAPESLENLMVDGKVPCLCSRCDVTCQDIKKKNNVHHKLVIVDSNESLGDIQKRNKKTIIKSGKTKYHKGQNSELIDKWSAEYLQDRKNKIDRQLSTIDNDKYVDNKASIRKSSRSKDRSKMNLDAYCTTSNTHTSGAAVKSKYNNKVKEAGTSRPSFTSAVRTYKHKDEPIDLYNEEKGCCSKPSFHFQCEDDVNSEVKIKKRTTLVSRLPIIKKKHSNNVVSIHNEKRYVTGNELHITKPHDKCMVNYITPRDDGTDNILNQITKLNLPLNKQEELKTNDDKPEELTVKEESSSSNRLTFNDDKFNNNLSGNSKSNTFCAPLINKNAILNSKNNNKIIGDRKTYDKTNTKCTDKNNNNNNNNNNKKTEDATGFRKIIENLKKDLSAQNTFHVKTDTTTNNKINKPIERSVKHTFSTTYKTEEDGITRQGYLSILKPTCGCPEITVFIPCYCDDNTIFGKEK